MTREALDENCCPTVRHVDLEVAACDSTLVAKVLQAKLFPV